MITHDAYNNWTTEPIVNRRRGIIRSSLKVNVLTFYVNTGKWRQQVQF